MSWHPCSVNFKGKRDKAGHGWLKLTMQAFILLVYVTSKRDDVDSLKIILLSGYVQHLHRVIFATRVQICTPVNFMSCERCYKKYNRVQVCPYFRGGAN